VSELRPARPAEPVPRVRPAKGATGGTGAVGATGATGATGPLANTGIRTHVISGNVDTVSGSDRDGISQTAACSTLSTTFSPGEWVLLGGGFDMGQAPSNGVPQGVIIEDSQPYQGGWRAVGRERPATAETWYVRAWANCADLTP
jgi:hypothetical protein